MSLFFSNSSSSAPVTINPPPEISISSMDRPVLSAPFCKLGITTSRVYLGVLNECNITPSQTSPATLSMLGFTPAIEIFTSGLSMGPGLKNGDMRLKE